MAAVPEQKGKEAEGPEHPPETNTAKQRKQYRTNKSTNKSASMTITKATWSSMAETTMKERRMRRVPSTYFQSRLPAIVAVNSSTMLHCCGAQTKMQ